MNLMVFTNILQLFFFFEVFLYPTLYVHQSAKFNLVSNLILICTKYIVHFWYLWVKHFQLTLMLTTLWPWLWLFDPHAPQMTCMGSWCFTKTSCFILCALKSEFESRVWQTTIQWWKHCDYWLEAQTVLTPEIILKKL